MNKTPQLENGYTKIANEILEALCNVNLSPYESRLLWCIIRKTYGFNKKEDWIANSQLIEATGLLKGSVSKAKAKLIQRKIVTQTGNKISFNKLYKQWRELPKQVTIKTVTHMETSVTQTETKVSIQRDTKETPTKETIQKSLKENLKNENDKESIESIENKFIDMAVNKQWCDKHYADKVIKQGRELRGEYREEFERKLRLCVGQGRAQHRAPQSLAKKVYHEIAGYVNDKGQMQSKLSKEEQAKRRQFAEEEYGKDYVEHEL